MIHDGISVAQMLYDGWGAVLDPTIASRIATFDNEGLIVPLPDLQKVLFLGGMPPPGYAVLTLPPCSLSTTW
jgi:hypothetical protein